LVRLRLTIFFFSPFKTIRQKKTRKPFVNDSGSDNGEGNWNSTGYGIGIHNFKIRSYIGDEGSGLIRWEWSPEHCAVFLGLDVAGKPFATQGHTFHVYNDEGLITRESSWWDAAAILRQLGMTADKIPAHLAAQRQAVGTA